MLDDPDAGAEMAEENGGLVEPGTLYALAAGAIRAYIEIYLQLVDATKGFTDVRPQDVQEASERIILLSGINSPVNWETASADDAVREWERMRAVPFDTEAAITKGVYLQLRDRVASLLDELEADTEGFLEFTAEHIRAKPYMLPVFQRLANIPSKAELKRRIGSVSDNAISGPAAARLAELLNQRRPGLGVNRLQLLQSIEPTLEGIVQDLVGRILLESIVANALDDALVPYQREADYAHISGVVYDFRADFVIPNAENPKAFIEVRKSSSRHASLYAKDKMFSAINWKGKNKELLGVLVVEGPWTAETLRVMTSVFDYVVPLSAVGQVVDAIAAYLGGDVKKLRWLIEFSITSPP
jgi:hypothetical protein